jgi:hypothetical protein
VGARRSRKDGLCLLAAVLGVSFWHFRRHLRRVWAFRSSSGSVVSVVAAGSGKGESRPVSVFFVLLVQRLESVSVVLLH